MISCENIVKEYKTSGTSTTALKGISIRIEDGDYIAIMGTSGSGKSTLLNIIGGMDTATGGTYCFNDICVTDLSPMELHRFRKDNISFVFQNFALINQYTVWENIELPLIAKGIKRKKRAQIISRVLDEVGMEAYKDSFPMNISGGQQQRCAIARALASENSVILADEPTGALDSATTAEILNVFRKLNESGKTIILVTHDRNVAESAKRVIHIEDGMITDDDDLKKER